MIISIFDQDLVFRYVSTCISPLTPTDVIGNHPWDWTSGREREKVKTAFSRCLSLGESTSYWCISTVNGAEFCFYNRLARIEINGTRGVLCVASVLPVEANEMDETDRTIVTLLAQGMSQKDVASQLGLSQPTISQREASVRRRLNIKSRNDYCYLDSLFS